jgi:ubiquitin-like 1-activating enzyme E1 B
MPVMQVSVHLRSISECYECTPRPPPKGFPICTIRNTPDKPIHCIVWAKDLLFERLFGPPDVITDLDEQQEVGGLDEQQEVGGLDEQQEVGGNGEAEAGARPKRP